MERILLPSSSRGMVVGMADSPSTLNRAAMGDTPSKEAIRLSKGMVDILLKAATVVDTSRRLLRSQVWVPLVVRRWGWVGVSSEVLFWVVLWKVVMVGTEGMGEVMEEVTTVEEEVTTEEEEEVMMVEEEEATSKRYGSERISSIGLYADRG